MVTRERGERGGRGGEGAYWRKGAKIEYSGTLHVSSCLYVEISIYIPTL